MLILVAVTVTVALQGGLFDTAKRAAKETKEAAEAEANMYEAEYYMAKANGETDAETYEDYMLETYYGGLEIGDYVAYDELSNGAKAYTPDASKGFGVSATGSASTGWTVTTEEFTTENLGWRVLGVNKSGELELISDNPTNNKIVVKNIEGFNNYVQVLNEMCDSLYGKGNLAKSARSLNEDDIYKLTGYDPTTYSGYGDEYTYVKQSDGIYINGVKSRYTDFEYYDKSLGQFVNLEVGDDPVTIKQTYCRLNLEGRGNVDVLMPTSSSRYSLCLFANTYFYGWDSRDMPWYDIFKPVWG